MSLRLNLTSDFISYNKTSESVTALGRQAAQSLVTEAPPSYEAEPPESPVSEGNAIMFQGKLFRLVEDPPPEPVDTDSSVSPVTSPSQFGDGTILRQHSTVNECAEAPLGFGVGHC